MKKASGFARAAKGMKSAAARITAWSFSRFRDWSPEHGGCPRKARYKHVERLREPEGPALQRGGRIHKLAEEYLLRRLTELPAELRVFSREFEELRESGAKPEVETTLDETWALIPDSPANRAWFSPRAWLRVKMDAQAFPGKGVLRIVDHKTGRGPDAQPRLTQELSALQLDLYGVAGMISYPRVTRVVTELWYLDSGDIVEEKYERKTIEDLREKWAGLVAPMLSDTKFAPNPGPWCRWCHFRKSNGGPCSEG